jgi:hypothetical protein
VLYCCVISFKVMIIIAYMDSSEMVVEAKYLIFMYDVGPCNCADVDSVHGAGWRATWVINESRRERCVDRRDGNTFYFYCVTVYCAFIEILHFGC